MSQVEEFFKVLQDISFKLRKIKEREITRLGLDDFSMTSFRYIEAIYKLGRPTIIELTKELELSKPTVTIMINKLVEQGFVNKSKSDQDGRYYYLGLSDKGIQVIQSYNETHKKFSREISTLFNEQEMETLNTLLKRI